ncbi:Anaphase-promoting complex subunit 10/DOC domain protein [Gracilaria domingensis]|nr:Anaphase-promoting complex subunit 10/DOC domain protein [Gracilaria domingensis]
MYHAVPHAQDEWFADSQQTIQALESLELRLRGLHAPVNAHLPNYETNITSDKRYDEGDIDDGLRDLTHQAVWTVSTAKPGNGVEQLLDGDPNTYWQSDGLQPHSITAHFSSKVKISEIHLYLNYDADESYTPAFISIMAGSNFQDLQKVKESRKIRMPKGWVVIPMGDQTDVHDECSDDESEVEREDMRPAERERVQVRRVERHRRRTERLVARQAMLDEKQKKAERDINGEFEAMKDRSVTKAHMIQIFIVSNHLNGRDSHVRMVRVLGPKSQLSSGTSRFTSTEFQMYETIR